MVLGLAFAALALPVTPAFGSIGALADGGPMPVSVAAVSSVQPSYLRYHEVGYPVGAGPVIRAEQSTITPLEADGLRWTKLAEHYQALQAQAAARPVSVSSSNGFDWTIAGIGASSAAGALLLLGLGITLARRNQRTGLTHA